MPEEHPLRADQFGNYQDSNTTQHSDPLALTQLLLTYHLLRQYSGVARLPFATPTAALTRVRAPQD
jgi:hypothetical protein